MQQDREEILREDNDRLMKSNILLRARLDALDRFAEGMEADRDRHRARVRELEEVLSSIHQYGSDTLSGPPIRSQDSRDWQREAVRVMTKRAREAIANSEKE